ncbi:hypothetical protein FHT12_002201 [Xanthomonas campestris]|uniref:hypothetical protein n=1 Tax=Xanthomonas euroxanthea TaxID=2259622 RepID=UPI000CEE6535|nr:hypothetical protein [Xanthomonas euroxanthea]
MAVNRRKPLQQTLVMPARLPMTMCYASVELFQREMQDDSRMFNLCPPARGAVSAHSMVIKRVTLDASVGMHAARRTCLVFGCHADDQLAVAHANVELAVDGEAQEFQPAAE